MKHRSLAYLLLFGAIGATATVASPGFDCDKARTSAERMHCQDQGLASLDRETDRLYGLARDGQFTTPHQRKELKLAQRRWIKRRDGCWQVADRQCLRDR